jgi:hypothetical protein
LKAGQKFLDMAYQELSDADVIKSHADVIKNEHRTAHGGLRLVTSRSNASLKW